jgi:hypothetical protein
VDAVTIGAVLLAIVSGTGSQLGVQLWEGVVSLVRRPFRHKAAASTDTAADAAAPACEAELMALQQAPRDQRKAIALAEALLARSNADDEFRQALEAWWQQARPIRTNIGHVTNAINGGTQYGCYPDRPVPREWLCGDRTSIQASPGYRLCGRPGCSGLGWCGGPARGRPAGRAGWERRDRPRPASGMPRARRQGWYQPR